MGGNRASKRRSAKRLSLARSLDDLEVGIDSLGLKPVYFHRNVQIERTCIVPMKIFNIFCEHPIVLDPWRGDSNHPRLFGSFFNFLFPFP